MSKRNSRLTVRMTVEESRRLTEAARQNGYQGVAQFARASLTRSATQMRMIDEMRDVEERQAATLTAVRTEIARLQRTEYVIFAMLENLAKMILTYMPPPSSETKGTAIAYGKASYDRYLKAVGRSLHNGSKNAAEDLARLDF